MKILSKNNQCVQLLRKSPDLSGNYTNLLSDHSINISALIINILQNVFINNSINAEACLKETEDILLYHCLFPATISPTMTISGLEACLLAATLERDDVYFFKMKNQNETSVLQMMQSASLEMICHIPEMITYPDDDCLISAPLPHPLITNPYFPLLIHSKLTRIIINEDIYKHSPPNK